MTGLRAATTVACLSALCALQLGCSVPGAPDARAEPAQSASVDIGAASAPRDGRTVPVRHGLAASSSADARSSSGADAPVNEFRTPRYVLDIPATDIEPGYSVEYDGSVNDFGDSGIGGYETRVYTPSSGDEPYFTVLVCTEGWVGLQGDLGESTSSLAFETTDADGTVWQTLVVGGPFGDYGSMTQDESLEFTRLWASRVRPASS